VEHERIKEDSNRSRPDVDLANEESTTGTDLDRMRSYMFRKPQENIIIDRCQPKVICLESLFLEDA
jgi:hypothetical protein